MDEKFQIINHPLDEEEEASTSSESEDNYSPLTQCYDSWTTSLKDEQHYHCGIKQMRNPLVLSICISDFRNSKLSYRKGCDVDMKNIENTFGPNGFNFEIISNKQEIVDSTTFRRLVISAQHKLSNYSQKYDSFIFITSTHGGSSENGKYSSFINLSPDDETSEYTQLPIKDILEQFSNGKNGLMGAFLGKPKIFIFQACRGHIDAKPVMKTKNNHNHCKKLWPKMNNYKLTDCAQCSLNKTIYHPDDDMYILQSTTKGYASYRTEEMGSLLINALTTELSVRIKNKRSILFNDIINRIKYKTQQLSKRSGNECIQTAESRSTLTYDIEIINPNFRK